MFHRPGSRHTYLTLELLEDRRLLHGGLAFGEPDYPVSIAVMPNDPQFPGLFGLNNVGQSGGTPGADISAPEAWEISRGSLSTVVGIIDTGIDYRHQDLYRNIWLNQDEIPADIKVQLVDTDDDGIITFWDLNNPQNQGEGKISDLNANGYIDGGDVLKPLAQGGWANGISEDCDTFIDDLIGWDFVSNDNDPMDDNRHGTHVAGTIGAIGDNEIGITGVSWRVQMMGLKFLDANGGGYTSGAVAALNYAVDHGASITNNSWGGGGFSTAMYNAIRNAKTHGVLFVAAAGNSANNNDLAPNYPSNYALDNVIAVAATDRHDRLAFFSNFGATQVDLAAPGVNILSTTPNNTYTLLSGTSMATPHVAGVLALAQSSNPELTYSQLITSLLGNVDTTTTLTGFVSTGGRLNAFLTLNSATGGGDITAPRILSATPNADGTAPVSSVRLLFSEAIDPDSFTPEDVTGVEVLTITPVPGTSNRQFDVVFVQESAPGIYPISVCSDITDAAGNRLDQDHDGTCGESIDDTAAFSFTILAGTTVSGIPRVAIPDMGKRTVSKVVKEDVIIDDLRVTLNIKHTFDADLSIRLIGPDGTELPLVNRRGGEGNGFLNTRLTDDAELSIANGFAPFSGSYRPESPLSIFDGKNARGLWKLVVEDKARQDVGKIVSWSLMIGGEVLPPTPTAVQTTPSNYMVPESATPRQEWLDAVAISTLLAVSEAKDSPAERLTAYFQSYPNGDR